MDPSSNVCKLYCYPDAGFTVTDGHEIPTDPACANITTGIVITFANFPVYWASNLKTETEISTMESEINALDHSCRELFPIIDITKSLDQAAVLPIGEKK